MQGMSLPSRSYSLPTIAGRCQPGLSPPNDNTAAGRFAALRDINPVYVGLGSRAAKLTLSITGPLHPRIADIRADVHLRCFGRVEDGRGCLRLCQLLRFPSPLIGRVEDWRAGVGRCLCSLFSRPFVCECPSISTVPRFQSPPRRTQRADFPLYALLFASPQGYHDEPLPTRSA
jgi:hypothetical protein